MKVYLDQSIVDEWAKFKSRRISLARIGKNATIAPNIIADLQAFDKILDLCSITFLYSSLNELEYSWSRKTLFDDLFSKINFVKVPAVGLRVCVADQGLMKDHIIEVGKVQSYFASHIRKFGSKNINDRNDFIKYMRTKFFDPMHIDSAINAQADIFITIDHKLLSSVEKHPELRKFLATKIRVCSPSQFIEKLAT